MKRLVTCNTDFEAQVIKGRLESEGIDSMLTNENMSNLYGGIMSTFTTVDVLVREEDYERAMEVLSDDTPQTPLS